MKYELVVAWDNGDKDIYEYADRESAEKAESNMLMALGNQIRWTGVRPILNR